MYPILYPLPPIVDLSAQPELDAPRLRRACEFLLARQHSDGGWGESYLVRR